MLQRMVPTALTVAMAFLETASHRLVPNAQQATFDPREPITRAEHVLLEPIQLQALLHAQRVRQAVSL